MSNLFDPHIFDEAVFDVGVPACIFDPAIFDGAIFDVCGTPTPAADGFRFRNQGLPRYLDTLDEDEEEAIFLMSASEVFGA